MANVYFIHLYFKETVELFTVYSHITIFKGIWNVKKTE